MHTRCLADVRGVTGCIWCLGLIIKPLIDLLIATLLFAMPASSPGLPERMSSILGILWKPLLPGTNPPKCVDLRKLMCHYLAKNLFIYFFVGGGINEKRRKTGQAAILRKPGIMCFSV